MGRSCYAAGSCRFGMDLGQYNFSFFQIYQVLFSLFLLNNDANLNVVYLSIAVNFIN